MEAVPSSSTLWAVRGGFLVSSALEFDSDDPLHRQARQIAMELAEVVPYAHSVRLAGSVAARHPDAPPPEDLDIAVVVDDVDLDRVREAQALLRSAADGLVNASLPLDVVAVPLPLLVQRPYVHLACAFGSIRVWGKSMPDGIRLRADWQTAWILWKERFARAQAMVEFLPRAVADTNAPPGALDHFVRRVQKNVLRLAGPVALARLQTYSTDFSRCARLLGRLSASLKGPSLAVLGDLLHRDASPRAIDRVIALAGSVFELGEWVRREAGPAANHPQKAPVHAPDHLP